MFGGVAPIPWTEENVNSKLKNMEPKKSEIEKLAKSILLQAEPLEQNNYKVILAKNLTNRILSNIIL